MTNDQIKIRQLEKELELLRSLARPFTQTRVYNPSGCITLDTQRTINIKAVHIFNLNGYFKRIQENQTNA